MAHCSSSSSSALCNPPLRAALPIRPLAIACRITLGLAELMTQAAPTSIVPAMRPAVTAVSTRCRSMAMRPTLLPGRQLRSPPAPSAHRVRRSVRRGAADSKFVLRAASICRMRTLPVTAAAVVIMLAAAAAPAAAPTSRPRAPDLGLKVGVLPAGSLDAITDVAGVEVGQTTIIRGEDIRTGVTAILPHPGNLYRDKVPGAIAV